jgi:hypothetical protein
MDATTHQLADHQNHLTQQHNKLAQAVVELQSDQAKLAQERVKKETIETLIKVQSALYSSAQAYTNVVLIGGYAAFFTIWSFTRTTLSERAMLWAALMMSASAATFILFETVKMVLNGLATRHFSALVKAPPEKFDEAFREYQRKANSLSVTTGTLWIPFLAVTVVTGYLAMGIVVYQFIVRLVTLG